MKINEFPGELTDVSAVKEALHSTATDSSALMYDHQGLIFSPQCADEMA